MTDHELDIYLELYKRKEYKSIPIGCYANGDYFYMMEGYEDMAREYLNLMKLVEASMPKSPKWGQDFEG